MRLKILILFRTVKLMRDYKALFKKRAPAYGYGMGEFGFTFFNFFVAYYLMYYLTDVLLLPVGVAAILYSVIQWVEGILMLAAGIVIDRHSARGGQYGPWAFWGSVICAVSTLLFYTNFHAGTTMNVVLFTVFYTLCYVGYNIMWVAYRTLLDPMSRTPAETILNSTAASQMGSLSGVVFSLVGTRLLYGFNTMQSGYTVSAIVYGCLMIGGMSIVRAFTRKRDVGGVRVESEAPSVKELLKSINKQFLILFFSITFVSATNTILPTLLVYYFGSVIGDPTWMRSYLLVITFTSLFGYFISPHLSIKYGKKKTFIFSCFTSSIALTMINFIGSIKPLFILMMIIFTFGNLFSGGMIPVFMNDIAVFNESNYGVRGHAFASSIGGCALRFSQVIGGALASLGLVSIGYSAEAEFTLEMGKRITRLMTFGCVAVLLISAFVFSFYKVEGEALKDAYFKEKAQQ